MELTLIYAVAISSVFGGLLLLQVARFCSNLIRTYSSSFVFRRLVYPTLSQHVPFLRLLTPWRSLLFIVYLGGTAFCNLWGINSPSQASARAATISLATMIPLCVTGRLPVAMEFFNLSIADVRALHSATGSMATLQSIIHIGIELSHTPLILKNTVHFYGFLASVGFATLLVLLVLQRRAYFIFSRTHLILVVFIVVTIWMHRPMAEMLQRPYLITAAALYVFLLFFQSSMFIVRNTVLRTRHARVELSCKGDSVQMDLSFSKPLQVKPGQFIYIWMPSMGLLSAFRTYPFMVMWQHPEKFVAETTSKNAYHIRRRYSLFTDEEKKIDREATLLSQPLSRMGISLRQMVGSGRQFSAWVDGPYGNPPDWASYDHNIFVACGMGIAAHMLAIKHLVEGREDRSIANKSVTLHWQINNTLSLEWVKSCFDYLLQLDYERTALNIVIYVPPGSSKDYSSKRIQVLDTLDDLVPHIKGDIDCLRGKVLLSVSATDRIRREVRSLCTQKYFYAPSLRYHESDFQSQPRSSWLFSRYPRYT